MKKALIIVDVQTDFCEGGALAVDGGNAVAENVAKLVQDAAGRYDLIVTTQDWHVMPGPHFASTSGEEPNFVDTWPDHCVAGTPGSGLHPVLAAKGDLIDFKVYKGMTSAAYSGFEARTEEGEPLKDVLIRNGINSIDVVGLAYDYCVLATALDGARLGFKKKVHKSFTASVDAGNDPDVTATLSNYGVGVYWERLT